MALRKIDNTQRETEVGTRNNTFFDKWSVIHFITSILFTMVFGVKIALLIVVLWEPFEIYVLSKILARYGITFGDETLKNSFSDLVFDGLGVLAGYLLVSYTFLEQLIVF